MFWDKVKNARYLSQNSAIKTQIMSLNVNTMRYKSKFWVKKSKNLEKSTFWVKKVYIFEIKVRILSCKFLDKLTDLELKVKIVREKKSQFWEKQSILWENFTLYNIYVYNLNDIVIILYCHMHRLYKIWCVRVMFGGSPSSKGG